MANPEQVRITLDGHGDELKVEVNVNGVWKEAQRAEGAAPLNVPLSLGASCGQGSGPCAAKPNLCVIYIGSCYYYSC